MTQPTPTTYRQQFADEDKAAVYDEVYYGTGTYCDVLWETEKIQLASILAGLRRTHPRIDYLDFAAGTGRIIGFLEDKVDTATGIEISPAMTARAQAKLTRARMICTDITAPNAPIEGKYDLITTFRFVLNAEPSLRLAGLKALAARLKDETGLLVFNNHGNLLSLKLLMWPIHRLRRQSKGHRTEGNVMTNGQARSVAHEAGLEIIDTIGCGALSGRALRFVSYDRAVSIEKRLANWPLLPRIGVNQMYVARLRR